MSSATWLGILMIMMGGVSIGIGGHRPLGPAGYIIAGLLVASGLLVLTRRPFAYYWALTAALVTTASGVLPYIGHPELALPIAPPLAIGVGAYLCLRVVMSRNAFVRSSEPAAPLPPPPQSS
jgi:hypothetical protein